MTRLRLTPDLLGRARFAFSPLAEVGASLRLLGDPPHMHLHDAWLRQMRSVPVDVDLDLLLSVCPPGRRPPGFLFPGSCTLTTTIDSQLAELAAVPAERLRLDLLGVWEGARLPPSTMRVLRAGEAGPRLLAEAVASYWTVALQPYWERMHGVFEDDIAYRCARATETGLFGVFSDLHADVSVEDDLLQVSWADTVAPTADACVLTLTPSVFAWPGILLSQDGERVQVTYTARGVGRVWEDLGPRRLPRAVAALLGRSRSAILLLLAVPMSTTQVARTLDQSPAAVNRHLSILRDNGLVTSWRSGRNILYRRTALASSVLGR